MGDAGIPYGAIDINWLTIVRPRPVRSREGMLFDNLAAILPNYTAMGRSTHCWPGSWKDRADVQRFRQAAPDVEVEVCLLTAPVPEMQERLGVREPGMFQAQALLRSPEVAVILRRR